MKRQAVSSVLQNRFSSYLVFVYTLIVFVPIIVFFFAAVFGIHVRNRKDIFNTCSDAVVSHQHYIDDQRSSMFMAGLMIRQNNGLMVYLAVPQNRDMNEIIDLTLDEVSVIEKVLAVTQLYAIRIFPDNDAIPERWPVILNSSREDVASLSRWSFNYRADYMGNSSGYKLPSACLTESLTRSGKHVGYLQVAMLMENFFPFLYAQSDGLQHSYVLRTDGDALSQVTDVKIDNAQGRLSQKDVDVLAGLYEKNGSVSTRPVIARVGSERCMVCWASAGAVPVVVFRTYSLRKTTRELLFTLLLALLALVISTLIFFKVIQYVTLRKTRGVYAIMDGMKKVQAGNFDVQIPVTEENDVGEAQRSFNSMTLTLRNQLDLIKQEQELIADTEMKAMQNQINAHFLYNILETIRMQAVVADEDSIAESIMMLGKMMRYCLRWRVHEVSLSQELEYIQSYIYILNIRNDYTITLEVSVPDSLMSHRIPKMLVQPVIENSFVHGIEPLAEDSVIRLYTETDAERGILWICVQDSGVGMSEEEVQKLRAYLSDRQYEREGEGSIGVKNIQQRLFMFYGSSYSMSIESVQGKGTLVRIPVPLGDKDGETV